MKIFSPILLLTLLLAGNIAAEQPRLGVVVKIGGIPWFNAMEAGIKEKGKELGISSFMVGPTSSDPAQQVRAIEDLIAQKVDVIGVVPNDSEVLEPVLAKARSRGIKVITHESPEQKNVDWNFELASVKGFGDAYGKLLAEKVGDKGSYAVFVGSLTVPLHNAWADAAIAYLKMNHPDLRLIGRYGVAENVDDSRTTALNLLAANKDLKGFLAFGSQGPIGAARAVKERRQQGKVAVLGPFSPGQGKTLLKQGVLSGGFIWNPKQAGKVFVELAAKLINDEKIAPGVEIADLGVVNPMPGSTNLIVDQLIPLTVDTVDELAALGL